MTISQIIYDFSKSEKVRRYYISSLMSEKNFSFIDSGHTRWVYLSPSKNFVLKFPRSYAGLKCNINERAIFRSYLKNKINIPVAKCRLIENFVLMMEAVECFGMNSGMKDLKSIGLEYPKWASLLDCHQVGINKRGEFVAYDYGDLSLNKE